MDEAVFSIPSPIQTSLLIKSSGAKYNKSLLNVTSTASSYSTGFSKALNMGVYGADVGYVAIYDQNQDALAYLSAVRKLADDLGLSSAFDMNLIKRFEANLGKKDSLIMLVSDGFRTADDFLQNNERKDIAALVIAGGWIEGLYFTLSVANESKTKDIMNRIAEQKTTLDNLIKILTPYYEQADFTEFTDALIDLAYDFDAIEVKYNYVPPTTDVNNKITMINSTTEVVITKEHLATIIKKVNSIRSSIIE